MLLADRLRRFMREYRLSCREVAFVLQTPHGTVADWLYRPSTPPGALGALLDFLEQHEECRRWAGVYHNRPKKPRGNGFKPGNPWRIGSSTRAAALKEARARKRKAAGDCVA